jgi:hypothetical protein
MSNNDVDGFPGLRIDQVDAKKNLSLELMPNVVLIELGTNDMTQNYSVATAHERIGTLVGRVVNAVPNVTVLLGTLVPNAHAESNVLLFNKNLVGTVANLTAQGFKVQLVDFHSDWWSLADIGPDGTHPTDSGYLKMSRVWYKAILEAAQAGNITAPTQVGGVNDFKAGNDSTQAHTAMNVVCQSVNSSVTGQVQACSRAGNVGVNVSFSMVQFGVAMLTLIDCIYWSTVNSGRIYTFVTIEMIHEYRHITIIVIDKLAGDTAFSSRNSHLLVPPKLVLHCYVATFTVTREKHVFSR